MRQLWALALLGALAGCGGDGPRSNAILRAPGSGPNAVSDADAIWTADRQWSRGEIENARATLRGVLETDPGSFPARYRLGVLLVPDDPEGAIQELDRAAELAPKHPGPPAFQGLARIPQSDFPGSHRDLERSLALSLARRGYALRDTTEAISTGLRDLRRARYRASRNAFEEAAAADSTNPVVWFLAARAAMELGDRERAERHAARALQLRPDFQDARVLRGQALFRLGRLDEARALRDEALAVGGAAAFHLDGLLQQADSNYRDAALAQWLAVLEDPLEPEHHAALGHALLRMSLPQSATHHMQYVEAVRAFLGRAWGRPGFSRN